MDPKLSPLYKIHQLWTSFGDNSGKEFNNNVKFSNGCFGQTGLRLTRWKQKQKLKLRLRKKIRDPLMSVTSGVLGYGSRQNLANWGVRSQERIDYGKEKDTEKREREKKITEAKKQQSKENPHEQNGGTSDQINWLK